MIDYLQKNWIEISGIVTSLICVWLNTQQSIWGWFWAIVSSGIYAITFFQSKLYSDMELQGVFILLALYGWYQWQFGKTQTQFLTVTNISRKLVATIKSCGRPDPPDRGADRLLRPGRIRLSPPIPRGAWQQAEMRKRTRRT